MKTKMIYSLLVIGTLIFSVQAVAEELDDGFKKLVDEMLEVSGALKVGEQMSVAMVGYMTTAMKAGGSEISDRGLEVMRIEVNETIRKELESGSFNELMYPIYAKYLNEDDLRASIAFYSTDVGRKMVEVTPVMMAEAMQVGQEWGAMIGPKIAENVRKRLEEEGIEAP